MFLFRLATERDFEGAWRVVDEARNLMLSIGRRQWTEAYPSREGIHSDICGGNAYVITQSKKVVAYGAVVVNGEPKYEEIIGKWLSGGDYMVVHRLAVLPGERGKGLAKAFFNGVESLCKGLNIKSIKIDTNYDNVEMLHLLPKLGYVNCGEIDYDEKGMRIAFEKLL